MKAKNDCSNRAQCIIDLLATRKEERRGAPWTPLLSDGQNLCNGRKEAQARQSFEQALKVSDDLAAVNDKDANRIKATALACLGALHLCKKEINNAISRFRQSASIFDQDGDRYGQAVALFAWAQAHESRKEWEKAFRYYEWSQHVLTHISSDSATIYLRQLVEERHSEAIKEWEKTSKEDAPVWETLGFLPIINRIPAGDPRSIRDEHVVEYIETDRLLIAGKPYYVANSKNPYLGLTFSPNHAYIAFRVSGDSMNNAGIDIGDYVILRTNSSAGLELVPESGNIVAVLLPEEETATLKRFHRNDTHVIFEPDSKNPSHKTYRFEKIRSGFPGKIIGIHIATLKSL